MRFQHSSTSLRKLSVHEQTSFRDRERANQRRRYHRLSSETGQQSSEPMVTNRLQKSRHADRKIGQGIDMASTDRPTVRVATIKVAANPKNKAEPRHVKRQTHRLVQTKATDAGEPSTSEAEVSPFEEIGPPDSILPNNSTVDRIFHELTDRNIQQLNKTVRNWPPLHYAPRKPAAAVQPHAEAEPEQMQDAAVFSEYPEVCLLTTDREEDALNLSTTSTADGMISAGNDEEDDLARLQVFIDAAHEEDEVNHSSLSTLVTLACFQPPLSTATIWRKTTNINNKWPSQDQAAKLARDVQLIRMTQNQAIRAASHAVNALLFQ